MKNKGKWRVSVYFIQYGFGGEYVWSIPDQIHYAGTYEEAQKMREKFLSGEACEEEVHRCEISEVVERSTE